jgi:hypothetical protein
MRSMVMGLCLVAASPMALAQASVVPGGRAPFIPRLAQSTSFGEWLRAFAAQGATDAGLDSCLPVVFHGSPLEFDAVHTYHSSRGRRNDLRWEGEAIFATADPRVALFYSYTRVRGIGCGIDLIGYTPPNKPISYFLIGGSSLEDAEARLYGTRDKPETCKGYVYVLNKQYFYREKGLGTMECISRDPKSNLWRLEVNRRQEIDELVTDGSVKLEWQKELKS